MGNQPSQTLDDIAVFDPRRSLVDGDSRARSYTAGDVRVPSMSALDRGVAAPAALPASAAATAARSHDTTTTDDGNGGAMGMLSHVWAALSPRSITKANGATTAKTCDATTTMMTTSATIATATGTETVTAATPRATAASQRRVEQFYDVSTQTLGRGHYAVVNRGRCRHTGRVVAVKKIKRFLTDEKRLRAEIAVLQRVKKHPNIVELIDVFETARDVHLVLELCTGGELFERLADKGPYSEADCARHLRDMATAVQYLHEQGIVHRDLKPENILLSTRNDVDAVTKVADFGLAKIFTGTSLKTKCGTWGYSAPEMISGSGVTFGYDFKVDSWSLGIILYILLCGFHPFDPHGTHADSEMIACIKKCEYDFEDEAWATISTSARDLIRHLLVLDPDERYSMEEVLRHPWLGGTGSATPLSPRIHQDLARFREQAKQRAQFDSFEDEVQNN